MEKIILVIFFFFFHLVAGFHCSFAVVPGISRLAYTYVWPTFLQEVCIYYDERVHQKKKTEMWRKDSWKFDDWKNDSSCQGFFWKLEKTTGLGPAICGVRELLVLTSSIPQNDTDSDPLISGGVSKVSCCSQCIDSQKYSQNISIGYFFFSCKRGKNAMSICYLRAPSKMF